ncbi:MAG: CZB domain-containing protein [Pseudanabaenaceae cyanobacterium]
MRRWLPILQQAIESSIIDPPPEIIEKDNQCVFGKWLYSEEIPPSIKASPQYEKVRVTHAQFHRVTAEIATLALIGEKEKAKEKLSENSLYTQLSDELRLRLLELARVI